MQKELESVELSLRKSLSEFEEYYIRSSSKKNQTMQNNTLILSKFIRLISESTKPLQSLLPMLTDKDTMNLALTCHTTYKIIYSPIGFRICRHLRPIIITSRRHQQNIPTFTKLTIDQLCTDRSLVDVDEDDKHAILLTMRTNILATKHKIGELDLLIEHFDSLTDKLKGKIMYLGGQRQQIHRKCIEAQQQVQKIRQVLRETQGHAQSLRQSQQKILLQRQNKLLILNEEKSKLSRQKQLLIKKIKSQQKQKQQGLIYAREVDRILARLSHITRKNVADNEIEEEGSTSNMPHN